MKTISLFDYEPAKITSKARFFKQIEPYLYIAEWCAIIAPFYHADSKSGGRPPKDLEIMVRTLLVQNFFSLSDEMTEDSLVDVNSIREFVGITPANEGDRPDKSTICRFRNLLVEHDLQQKIFGQVIAALSAKGLIMRKGAIVDSAIIESPASKRNADKACDPQSGWTKKAGTYRHGFKAHIGADADSGLVTEVVTTAANVHDVTVANDLISGEEEAVYGDSGYLGIENRRNSLAKRKYHIMRRRSSVKKLPTTEQERIRREEQAKASVRAKVEHCFATVKRLFGWRRTTYRGLSKNAAKLNLVFALANIWKISRICPA